jgi:hypothetical protein
VDTRTVCSSEKQKARQSRRQIPRVFPLHKANIMFKDF